MLLPTGPSSLGGGGGEFDDYEQVLAPQRDWAEEQPLQLTATLWALSALLCLFTLCTLIGNLFVIVAIFVDKNLQTTGNQLVLSLACADLMVACLVMPLGAYNEIRQGWYLGERLCEFWTSADVLCCTGKSMMGGRAGEI